MQKYRLNKVNNFIYLYRFSSTQQSKYLKLYVGKLTFAWWNFSKSNLLSLADHLGQRKLLIILISKNELLLVDAQKYTVNIC